MMINSNLRPSIGHFIEGLQAICPARPDLSLPGRLRSLPNSILKQS